MMTDKISFTVADIPPADPVDDDNNTQTKEYTCDVCGTPLAYGGRGRPPTRCDEHKRSGTSTGSSSRAAGPRRSNKDVDAAMAALDAAHTSLSFVFMLASPDAASVWEAQRPSLDARNRRILESDPALAKRIATTASKGGMPALVLSHLIAVAPTAAIAYTNIRANAAERRAMREAQQEYIPDDVYSPASPSFIDDVLAG